jgi:nucleoside-diphosphate-sugar epimerase
VGGRASKGIVVTGASGYVGRLLAAALLEQEDATLILPFRGDKHTAEAVLAGVLAETRAGRTDSASALAERLLPVSWPGPDDFGTLLPFLQRHGVDEVVHCAGSLSYFNRTKLQAGNIDLTGALLGLSERLQVKRFFYLSTAFCSGFLDGPVPESLHPKPATDPTEYTRSKREAEWLVAGARIPYVIVRPSIVIGDSHDGRYVGKPYGLYQLWSAVERFGTERYIPVVHAIAPSVPLQVLHQDALQAAFLALRREQRDNSVVHVVSREETLPTVRDLWDLWLDAWAWPQEIYYYNQLDDVPLDDLDPLQRLLVEFASANIEISTRAWRFEAPALAALRSRGLQFRDATVQTVGRCQQRFIEESPRIQTFLEQHRDKRTRKPRIIEVSPEHQ